MKRHALLAGLRWPKAMLHLLRPAHSSPKTGNRMRSRSMLSVAIALALVAGFASAPQARADGSSAATPDDRKTLCEIGTVTLLLSIDETGTVTDSKVTRSSGYPDLDNAALDSSKKWKFKPAQRDGKAVSTTLPVKVKFHSMKSTQCQRAPSN